MTAAETSHDATVHATGTLQGAEFDLEALTLDHAARAEVLERAFDFRGDVTLRLSDGRVVSGYIFDRRRGPDGRPEDGVVRLLPQDSDQKVTIRYPEIRRIEFGKDAAHGKTWENWVKRYVEKKLSGERASIESEQI
ncbi:MAG: hypothetical protein AB7K52_09910 [Phycisphaerales bacterium]